jgi:hypothetical protein
MTLKEAIDLLDIEGYPTTQAMDAIALNPSDPEYAQKRAAVDAVWDFLRMLRDTTPELQAAYDTIPWGAGSPTEYQGLHACLVHYGGLEAKEAERRGAPNGAPRARTRQPPAFERPPAYPSPGDAHRDMLYERARRAGVETWGEMQAAVEAAIDDPNAPPAPSIECVDLILRLQAQGMAEDADSLTTALLRWLDCKREDAFVGPTAMKWKVAQELSVSTLPLPVRKVVAQAAREGDLGSARPFVRRFCAQRDVEENDLLAAGMSTDAPTILQALGDALTAHRRTPDR